MAQIPLVAWTHILLLACTAGAQPDEQSRVANPPNRAVHNNSRIEAGLLPNAQPLDGHDGNQFDHSATHDNEQIGILSGWLEEWPHTHFSRNGTPFVHAFGFEPAFLGRELFFDFTMTSGDEGSEYELETELEYAFTRRLGVVVEAPFAAIDSDDGPDESGVGDVAIVPRALLVETDGFLLATNIEVVLETGDKDKGLGAGEVIVAPSLSTWLDLGGNFTLQGNIGVEHGSESNLDVMVWGGALAHSIYTRHAPDSTSIHSHALAHFPAGQLNLVAEIGGEHPLDGDDKGQGTAAWTFGASYSITPNVDVRAGVHFPAWNPREFDNSATLGLILHF